MIRLTTIFTSGLGGGPWYSNQYFSGDEGVVALDAKEAVVGFWTAVNPLISDQVSWVVQSEAYVIEESTGTITGVFPVGTAGTTGASTADALPLASQALVRLSTGDFVNGRRVQGRIYVPGLTETSGAGGLVSSSAVTTIEAAAEDNLGVLNPPTLVVWHRPGTGLEDGSQHNVTSTSVWNQFAVLRSRRD